MTYVLTVKQPWADLIMAGVKDVENRSWPVPSTLPQWWRCPECDRLFAPDVINTAGHQRADFEGVCWGEVAADGPFPLRLSIHAGKQPVPFHQRIHGDDGRRAMDALPWTSAEGLGALLGFVTVTGCHRADACQRCSVCRSRRFEFPCGGDIDGLHTESYCSRWAEPGQWHWTLADPEPLDEPVPMRGRQKLWQLPFAQAVTA